MYEIDILGIRLQLLPEKAVFIKELGLLLVSDVHLGKSETFQASGIPIANRVNQATIDRLQRLCVKMQPQQLIILGDLFHSRFALVNDVLGQWNQFLEANNVNVQLIVGNHDRRLIQTLNQLSISCIADAVQLRNLRLSHEPESQPNCLNICGHIHPCLHLQTKLDQLRLPCFFHDKQLNQLILPSFGEFTGGYSVKLTSCSMAYVVVDETVVPFGR